MQAFAANAAKHWLTATDGITVPAADRTIRVVVGLVAFRVSAVGSPP